MEQLLLQFAPLILALWLLVWLFFLVPIRMARNRNRAAFAWVLLGVFFSPLLPILLLYALGPAYRPEIG